jgi:hypothetical protein
VPIPFMTRRPAAPGGSVTAEVTVTGPNNDSPALTATVACNKVVTSRLVAALN